jgi:hypothetical protein
VGAAVYRVPQDWLRGLLLFANALFFFGCFGVAHAISITRDTWSHAESAAVWMWKNMAIDFSTTTNPSL